MGAISISRTVEAVKDSITSGVIHGWSERSDCYSGDWNTCSRVAKRITLAEKAGKWTMALEKKVNKIVEETRKGDSVVIDLGIVGYDVVTMKKFVKKATAKFEKRYVVYYSGDVDEKAIKSFKTQKEAFDFTEKYSLEKALSYSVKVDMVKVSGTSDVKKFEVTRTRKTRKPTGKTVRFLEVHKYLVVGWASC